MPHTLVVGVSGCGKSRLMREAILPAWWARGVAALVLDPIAQAWGAGAPWVRQWTDPLAFLAVAQRSRRAVLVLDECGQHVGLDHQLARRLGWCATVSRNNGLKAYFLGQRAFQIPPNMRNQCEEVYAFRQPLDDAEEACAVAGVDHRQWAPMIARLPKGIAIRFRPFEEPQKIKVF